jgi:hypothetical protein
MRLGTPGDITKLLVLGITVPARNQSDAKLLTSGGVLIECPVNLVSACTHMVTQANKMALRK